AGGGQLHRRPAARPGGGGGPGAGCGPPPRPRPPGAPGRRGGPRAARAGAPAPDGAVDSLVAMGGGSATGMAKAVALERPVPIVAVPTTYAGSEVTPIYGLTGPEGKRTGRDPRVLPRTVLYDPALTTGLPAQVTGPSGMNALAHCVEALYAPGANPVTSLLATEGARRLAAGLPGAVADPGDLAA